MENRGDYFGEGKGNRNRSRSGKTQYLQIAEYGREEIHPESFCFLFFLTRGLDWLRAQKKQALRAPGSFLGLLWLRLTGGSPEQGLGCGEALGFSPRASFSFRQGAALPSDRLPPGRLNLLVRARDSPDAPSPSFEERPAVPSGREISRSFALPAGSARPRLSEDSGGQGEEDRLG